MRSRKHSGSKARKRSGLTSYLGGARERVGTAGFILAIIALTVALGGGAFAIAKGGGLTAKEKKEVKNIAKGLVQPGPPGAQGPAGSQGQSGSAGKDGNPGAPGEDGKDGKSVTVTEIPVEEEECEEQGGAEVKEEGANQGIEVCNGVEGSPWTVGGTLPSTATLTGSYGPLQPAEAVELLWPGFLAEGEEYLLPLSFPIPVTGGAQFEFVPTAESGGEPVYGTKPGCPGVANDIPKANAGKLCVYASPSPGLNAESTVADITGVTPTGTVIGVTCSSGDEAFFDLCSANGIWAVTG